MTSDTAFRPWTTARRVLGEGLRRVEDSVEEGVEDGIVTVDILAGTLARLDPEKPGDGDAVLRLDVPLGAVAPVAGRPGTWLAAAGTGVALLGSAGSVEWLGRPEDGAPVAMRVNDACCDAQGRFWFGTMAYDHSPGRGSVYRVERDGSVVRVLEGFDVPNGPAFTADGRVMYLADTPRGRIDRYTLDPVTGMPREVAAFVQLPPDSGKPDGMTVDDDGYLWTALWGAGRVHRYAPDGTLDRALTLPASQPTSPLLYDGRLFVATAAYGLDAPTEHDGRVLVADAPGISAPATTAAVLN